MDAEIKRLNDLLAKNVKSPRPPSPANTKENVLLKEANSQLISEVATLKM